MTSEEKLTRIMHGGATPEHRVEMLRELISEEVARQLQREPIPGPSFEGGAAAEWEPKRGDLVEVVDSRGFDPDSEIKAGDVVKCVGKRNGRLFLLQGSGQYLAKASIDQIKPVSIQEVDRLPHTQVQEDLIQEDLERILREEAEENEPQIIPAEPLGEMPNQGEIYHFAHTLDKAAYCNIMPGAHKGKWEQVHYQFQAGLIFPFTPEGKAGAELRAKQGIVPYPVRPAKALTKPLEGSLTLSKQMMEEIERIVNEGNIECACNMIEDIAKMSRN